MLERERERERVEVKLIEKMLWVIEKNAEFVVGYDNNIGEKESLQHTHTPWVVFVLVVEEMTLVRVE